MILKNAIKNLVKRLFFRMGADVSRLTISNSERALAFRLLKFSGATTIIDVGANIGQFAQEILLIKPNMRIVSYEPLSSAHEILRHNASGAKNWKVADRMALGAEACNGKINIAGNSASSSLRQMKEVHSMAAPESCYVSEEQVDVKRLDEVYVMEGGPNEKIYLKIDTQGYEAQVLAGASKILPRVVALQTEGSLVELYEGQRLAFDLIRDVEKLGFTLFAIANCFSDPRTGKLLQVDLYFIRTC